MAPPRSLSRILILPGMAAALAVCAAAQNVPSKEATPAGATAAGGVTKAQPANKAAAGAAKPRRASNQLAAPAAANKGNSPTSQPATQPTSAPKRGKVSSPPAAQKAALKGEPSKPASRPVGKAAQRAAEPSRSTPEDGAAPEPQPTIQATTEGEPAGGQLDFFSMLFVFMLATFIGLGVIMRVSRLLHTPLMSLTNAISAIAVVGSIVLAGGKHYPNNWYHFWGAVALFASMTNIVSGFLITDRMLKMFKTREGAK